MTLTYALITPARNEADRIEDTVRSVIAQTLPPLRWVIVSDGSDDGTEHIVAAYAARHDFVRLVRREKTDRRSFASKVAAFRRGYAEVESLPFDLIGNLDADVSLEPEHYARCAERFAAQPRLGICGAIYENRIGGRIQRSRTPPGDTPGCTQLFRRECYEQIGGYLALELGGEDTVAAAMARMRGWETRSFREPRVIHRRRPESADAGRLLRRSVRDGAAAYRWGTHPLFILAKAVARLGERPRVLGSAALARGYFNLWLRRSGRAVSDDVVRFVRREQIGRLRRLGK